MTDTQLHRIQEAILARLLHSDGLHYSDIKPQEMEGSQFTFHLSKLVERGLVVKNSDGIYVLTDAGKNESNSIDFDSTSPRKQAKHSAVFCATRNNRAEFLVYTRFKNPFYGCQGFPTGKIQYGESSYETAKRELFEECHLEGEPTLIGIRHYRVYNKEDKTLLEDKVMYIFEICEPVGDLMSNKEGRFEWVSKNSIGNTIVNPLEEFEEIFDLLCSFDGTITYKEVTHYTDRF